MRRKEGRKCFSWKEKSIARQGEASERESGGSWSSKCISISPLEIHKHTNHSLIRDEKQGKVEELRKPEPVKKVDGHELERFLPLKCLKMRSENKSSSGVDQFCNRSSGFPPLMGKGSYEERENVIEGQHYYFVRHDHSLPLGVGFDPWIEKEALDSIFFLLT